MAHGSLLTPGLRELLRLLDGAAASLTTVHGPPGGDYLRGPLSGGGGAHAIPILLVCLRGAVGVRFRHHTSTMSQGQAMVVPAATWYRTSPPRRSAILVGFGWLGVHADLWTFGLGDQLHALLPLEPYQGLLRRLSLSADEQHRLALAREFLQALALDPLDGLSAVPAGIRTMIDLILGQSGAPLLARDLVVASGLGTAQAYATFRRFYGIPPAKALELRRLELASALLAAGHGVARTAEACGWRRRETFTRAWVRWRGSPPMTTIRSLSF